MTLAYDIIQSLTKDVWESKLLIQQVFKATTIWCIKPATLVHDVSFSFIELVLLRLCPWGCQPITYHVSTFSSEVNTFVRVTFSIFLVETIRSYSITLLTLNFEAPGAELRALFVLSYETTQLFIDSSPSHFEAIRRDLTLCRTKQAL